MSILPSTNPGPVNPAEPAPGTKPERPPRPKKKGKNYAQIHSKPLPLETHPLPAFHPSNPISLLRLAYTFISHILSPPVSHPAEPYIGYFSPETRSVHVTHPEHVRALWEMGFFGKGILSRSEPSWLEREEAKLRRERFGAEEATNARREERRLFKLERARAEAEKIYRQRLVEGGKVDAEVRARCFSGRKVPTKSLAMHGRLEDEHDDWTRRSGSTKIPCQHHKTTASTTKTLNSTSPPQTTPLKKHPQQTTHHSQTPTPSKTKSTSN